MSRSIQTDNIPNPAKRFFEWGGSSGSITYYDKESKQKVDIGDSLTFLLLDELSTIKGWHDASESSIWSNEVKNTTRDSLSVQSFKGGPIATGLYKEIRNKIIDAGGHYVASIYFAYRDESDELVIGNIGLKGAALQAWGDFKKKLGRGKEYEITIQIHGSNEGKKGRVVYKTPIFIYKPLDKKADKEAKDLDGKLQDYLAKKRSQFNQGQDEPSPETPTPKEKSDLDVEEEEYPF